jgi:hypothetical protein
MTQFKEDCLASERTQVFLLLKTEVLINRNLAEKARVAGDIKKLEESLDAAYASFDSVSQMSDDEKAAAAALSEQLSAMRAGQHARTTEFVKLQEKHSDLVKQLKATRDQRLKRIESSKESFIELVKELMEEDNRNREGEQMELMRLAATKEAGRLGEYHEFLDGAVDRPLLNEDTVGATETT